MLWHVQEVQSLNFCEVQVQKMGKSWSSLDPRYPLCLTVINRGENRENGENREENRGINRDVNLDSIES